MAKEFAKISEVKKNSILQADGKFTCLEKGAFRVVREDNEGLYIRCDATKHYLDGQKKKDHYVGLYLITK